MTTITKPTSGEGKNVCNKRKKGKTKRGIEQQINPRNTMGERKRFQQWEKPKKGVE